MQVFISRDWRDETLARRVAEALERKALRVWEASNHFFPGDNWGAALGDALEKSDAMVVLVTPNAMQSPNVNFELGYALGQQRFKGRVVPVYTAPPDQLPDAPWILRQFRGVYLEDPGQPTRGLDQIADTLNSSALLS